MYRRGSAAAEWLRLGRASGPGRLALAICLLGSAMLCTLASKPPEISPPSGKERVYRVKGVGLSIRPFADKTYLRFESGVTVSGEGFSLSAGAVELEIATDAMGSIEGLRLPESGVSREELSRDPGELAQRMSRELELPQATFNRSAIKRLSASGGVEVKTPEVTLSTDALLSIDGGQSWSTSGRAQLARSSGKGSKAENYSLAADALLYDTASRRAAAEGNIVASFARGGEPAVKLTAAKLDLDISRAFLKVSGGLTASYDQITLVCRELEARLEDASLKANGAKAGEPGPVLTDSKRGLSLQAGVINVDLDDEKVSADEGVSLEAAELQLKLVAAKLSGSLKEQIFTLSGKVRADDTKHDVSLSAETIKADVANSSYSASGSPVVRQGESTFTGERITVRQEKVEGQKEPKTVVEVHGEQEARIDMDAPPQMPADPR